MTLDRRAILTLLASTTLGLRRAGAATSLADLNAMTLSWISLADQATAFRIRAMKRGLTANFVPGQPIDLTIAAPASETEVLAVETEVGRMLPLSLRSFFRDFTSHFAISWVMPGPNWVDEKGQVHEGIPLSPPSLTLIDGSEGPEIGGGQIDIALSGITKLWRSHQVALRSFETKSQQESDGRKKKFYELRQEFYDRAFPLSVGEEGDVIGIDMTDTRERLLLLSGEAADEPGFFLGQNLHEHLNQQAGLGFIGFILSSMLLFKNASAGDATVASSLSPFEVSASQDGLLPPGGVVVDSDGENGRAWRTWLGP